MLLVDRVSRQLDKVRQMRSSKSRSRSKSNRQRSLGNIVNRVFDSSGPEGKVRGTPQQIIDKYLMLARDAQVSNDRVAEQAFLQHAEHYTRLLGDAQREMAERQQNHYQQNFHAQQNNRNGDDGRNDDAAQVRAEPDQSRNPVPEQEVVQNTSAEAGAEEIKEVKSAEIKPEEAPVPKPRSRRQKNEALPDIVNTGDTGESNVVDTPETHEPASSHHPRTSSTRSATSAPRTRRKPVSSKASAEKSGDQ